MTENCNLVLMKQWVLSLMIPLTITCAAQTNHSVMGSVVDSAGIAIPYASVIEEHHTFGLLTDANGRFIFSVPDSLKSSSVTFSCIGYESKFILISSLLSSQNSRVVLKEKPFLLHDVSVTSSKAKFCSERRGSLAKRSRGGFLFSAGSEIGVFIPTVPGDSDAVISAVRYYIGKRGIPTAPFRVVLYKVDSVTKGPGESLLEVDTIVHADKGGGWLEIDLRSYNIAVPQNGFFVGMQWLPDAEAYSESFGDHTMEGNGQVAGGTWDRTQSTWVRTLTVNWTRVDTIKNSGFNAMFVAVISSECPEK